MNSKFSPEAQAFMLNGGFVHCKDLHDFSCEWNTVDKFFTVMNIALKFYLPVHFIPVLIFKRKQLKERYLLTLTLL